MYVIMLKVNSLVCFRYVLFLCYFFNTIHAQNILKEPLDFQDDSKLISLKKDKIKTQQDKESKKRLLKGKKSNQLSSKAPKTSSQVKSKGSNALTNQDSTYKKTIKSKIKVLNNQEIQLAFKTGQNAYLYGNYDLVIDSLQRLVSPNLLLSNPADLAIAYELLGLAYFYLNRTKQARAIFKDLIFFRPQYSLDPVRVPPDAVIFFQQLKDKLAQDLAARQAALEQQRKQEISKQKAQQQKEVILEHKVNSRLLSLFPFGIGQFQNQDYRTGYFFLTSQLLTSVTSITLFFSIESLRQSNGRFTQEELNTARNLQTAQLVSGGIALGLMLSGIIHALLFFQEKHFIRRSEILNNESIPIPNSSSLSEQGILIWHF